ncbi:hypothetical protein YB2330_002177 [Saitoella coloradoensis]
MNGHRPFTTPDPASDPSSDDENDDDDDDDDDRNQVVLLTSNGRASRLSGIWSVDHHQNPVLPPQPQVVTTPALNVRPRPRSPANSAFGSVFGATGTITSRNRRSSIASTSSSHNKSSSNERASASASATGSGSGSGGGGVRTSSNISLRDGLQTSLLREIHRLRSEREHLYTELQSLHASHDTLSHAHTTLSNQHRQLVGAYGNSESVHEKLTGTLGATSTALENSRGFCRELRRRVAGLEREVTEVDGLREKVRTLEDRARGEKGARAALLERIGELEASVAVAAREFTSGGRDETPSVYEDAASTSYPSDSVPDSPLTPTMSMGFPSATLADELEGVKVCVDREVQTEGWRSPEIEIRVEEYVEREERGCQTEMEEVETIPEHEIAVKAEELETSTDAEAEYVTATSGVVSTSHTPPPLPPPPKCEVTSIDYRASTTTIRPLAECASTATIRPLDIDKIRGMMRETDTEAPASTTKASSPTLSQSPDPALEIETEPESDRETNEGRVVLLTSTSSSTSPASPVPPTKSITPLIRRHRPDPLALEIRSPVAVEVQSPTFEMSEVSPTQSFAEEVVRSPGSGEGGWFEPEVSGSSREEAGGGGAGREGKGKEGAAGGGGWTEGTITDSPEKVPRGDKIPYPPSTANHDEGDTTVGLLKGERTPPPPFPIPERKSSLRMRARRGSSSSSIPTKASQVLGITDVNGLGVATSESNPLLEAKLAENDFSAKLDHQQQSVKKERLRMLHAEVEKEAWPQDRRSRLILSEALLDPDMDLSDLGLETPGTASAAGKPKPKSNRPPPSKSPHKAKSALELSRSNSPAINIVTPLTPPLPSPMPMPTVEPASVIDAVASCMIGEMMYKYVRKKNGFFSPTRGMDDDDDFGGTGTRHKRWVWLSVSDMTICWAGRERVMREGGGKKLTILNVTEVKDFHSRPREIMQMARLIMITTPERSVTFTALSHERHTAWMSALHFLVHHDPWELITYERNTPSPRAMYELQDANSPSPARTDERSRQGSEASIEPVQRSGTDPLRPHAQSYGTPSPDARRPSLPVNLRQSVAASSCSPVRLGTPKASPTPPSYRGMNKLNSAPPPNVPRFVAASPSGGRKGSLLRTEEEANGREVGTLRMAAFVSSGDPFTGF